MSLFDYRKCLELAAAGTPFYALIMAAMKGADDQNLAKLRTAWPEVWNELMDRHKASGGLLPGEIAPEPECPHGLALDMHCCECGRTGFFPPEDCSCFEEGLGDA